MTISVSIIIPVLNQWFLTERCLHALARHSPDGLEVIIVDNASSDETQTSCPILGATLFGSKFLYLRQEANLNFGPASNLGAAAARGNYLFFLNNDTEVRSNWLPPLLKALENSRIGAVGPRLLYPNGRVQHVGIAFTPQLTPVHLFEHFPGDHPTVLRKRRFQAITAAALLISKQLFMKLAGFHEKFQNGSEDIDLCARIRAQGFDLSIAPESVIVHHTSQSAGRFDHDDANAALLRQRQNSAFVPDLHLFARQAGYKLKLTPWLLPFMTNLRTAQEAQTNDLDFLRKRLQDEPLWEAGYEMLATAAYDQGDPALTLQFRFLQSQFFPDMSPYQQLQKLAQDLGKNALAQDVAHKIQIIKAISADRQKLVSKAQALAAHFRSTSQPELLNLYRDWLTIHACPS